MLLSNLILLETAPDDVAKLRELILPLAVQASWYRRTRVTSRRASCCFCFSRRFAPKKTAVVSAATESATPIVTRVASLRAPCAPCADQRQRPTTARKRQALPAGAMIKEAGYSAHNLSLA